MFRIEYGCKVELKLEVKSRKDLSQVPGPYLEARVGPQGYRGSPVDTHELTLEKSAAMVLFSPPSCASPFLTASSCSLGGASYLNLNVVEWAGLLFNSRSASVPRASGEQLSLPLIVVLGGMWMPTWCLRIRCPSQSWVLPLSCSVTKGKLLNFSEPLSLPL